MLYFIKTYKTQLLISITIAIAIIALGVVRSNIVILMIVLASLLGTFILDFDYFIHTYFMEPHTNFSKNVNAFIKHKDITNLLRYIEFNKNDISEKTLNSALFQIVLAIFSIFAVSSNVSFFIKALVLSTLSNSIYRAIEAHYTNQTKEWFWAFKKSPNTKNFFAYIIGLILVLIYCFSII